MFSILLKKIDAKIIVTTGFTLKLIGWTMTTDPNDIARYLLSCAKPVIIPCIMNNLVVFLSLIISLKPSLGKIITNHDAVAAIYDTNTPEYGDEYPFTTIAIKIDAIATNTETVVAIRNPFMNLFLSICS